MKLQKYQIEYWMESHDSDGPEKYTMDVNASSPKHARQQVGSFVRREVNRINESGALARGGILKVYKVHETLEEIV
jgi:hypothetical protein